MSLAATVEHPNISPVYTLELSGKVLLKGWLVYSADAYQLASNHTFLSVQFNGTALTSRASIVLVEANDGSYFQDTDGTVYVNPPTGESIYDATVQGVVLHKFAKGPSKIATPNYSGASAGYFESRIVSIPTLSLRIEPRFSGVGQVGGGTCELLNGDGYFNDLDDVDWDRAAFYMGADRRNSTMDYADYEPLGSYRVEDWKATRERFTLTLREPKTALNQRIPSETFTREDYPNIDQNKLGKVIPRIYGRCYSVEAHLIDTALKKFKVAGHAVYEIAEAKILQDNVWVSVPFASRDEANGEFTLGAEWDENQDVCADVVGVKNADGSPMFNAADVVQDILEYIGETNFDTASFSDAHDALAVGLYLNGQENCVFKPSLYIDSSTTALELIGKINNIAGSFLYVNQSGEWHYEVFEPLALGDIAATYTDADILVDSFNQSLDTRDVFSRVVCRFAKRNRESWSQSYEVEREQNQRRAMASAEILKEIDAPLFDERDAQYYAQRILTTDAEPLAKFQISVKWRGLLRKPGDQIAINFSAQGIDGVFEVLEARHDLNSNRVLLVCGDRRAWGDSFGWWVADATPDWNAAGTDAEKREAKQTAGYWHGDNDLADDADSVSVSTSRWF